FYMAAVERYLPGRIRAGRNGREDILPNAPLAPTRKPIIDCLVRSILTRAVLPTTADPLHMHDPTQNPPIIVALRTLLIGRQMRFHFRPLLIVEPEQIRAHRLGLRIG